MKTKTCCSCHRELPVDRFHKRKSGYQNDCKDCKKTSDRQRYLDNRDKILARKKIYKAEFKQWYMDLKRGPCVDCKQTFHPAAMQWDHIGTDKVTEIGTLRNDSSRSKVLEEIKKCELVCACCHAVRTYKRLVGE